MLISPNSRRFSHCTLFLKANTPIFTFPSCAQSSPHLSMIERLATDVYMNIRKKIRTSTLLGNEESPSFSVNACRHFYLFQPLKSVLCVTGSTRLLLSSGFGSLSSLIGSIWYTNLIPFATTFTMLEKIINAVRPISQSSYLTRSLFAHCIFVQSFNFSNFRPSLIALNS